MEHWKLDMHIGDETMVELEDYPASDDHPAFQVLKIGGPYHDCVQLFVTPAFLDQLKKVIA